MKWTEQMNRDVLECKRQAQVLAASDNALCNINGRKKGYIKIMKKLWDEKGYEHLGFKEKNLRDQASWLEKNQEGLIHAIVNVSTATGMSESVLDTTQATSNIADNTISCGGLHDNRNQNNGDQQSQNHNQTILDLHTSALPKAGLTEERDCSTFENASDRMPGSLPEYKAINTPSSFIWGRHSDGRTITVNASTIDNAYNEITKWRKNTFLVPYGKTEKDFIDKLTQNIND